MMRSGRGGKLDKPLSCAASCALLFLAGSSFAIGELAREAASDQTWEASFSLMALVSAPSMILTGLFMDKTENAHQLLSSKTKKSRLLILMSATSFALLSLGCSRSNALIVFAVAVQGVPLGIAYLLGNELLGKWMPESAGLGIGLGQMAFGMGTIVFSGVFNSLMKHFGRHSIAISSFLLSAPSLALSLFVSYPSISSPEREATPILTEIGVKIPPHILLRERSFLLYALLVFTAQAGFAFMPLFFRLGASFGRSLERVVLLFQLATFLSTAARLAAGVLADRFSFETGRVFSSGSKNLLRFLFAFQAFLFFVLLVVHHRGHFHASIFMVTGILMTYSAANCSCTLLARDIFSSENSATVFGVGAGMMMGVGEAASTGLGSWIINKYGASPGQSGFSILFLVLLIWSLVGFWCAELIDKCKLAFVPSGECEYGAVTGSSRGATHLSAGENGETFSIFHHNCASAPPCSRSSVAQVCA